MDDYTSKQFNKILSTLFTEPEHLSSLLHSIDREVLVYFLVDILNRYANDVNSSSLRELITILKAGYEPEASGTKLGYNGLTSEGKPCEVKPVNIRSDSNNKLNGGGNFSDFTYERLDSYKADRLVMLVSGFLDGRLLYILQFPFSYLEFVERLRKQLERHFARGQRKPGQYLRSAGFTFIHYKSCPELQVLYKSPRLADYKQFLTIKNGLFKFLQGK